MVKNKTWKIVLVGFFSENYLVDIAYAMVKNAAKGLVVDIDKDVLAWKKRENDFSSGQLVKKSRWDGEYKVLPLFICEKIDDLRKCGLACPYEFVIERRDLFDGENYKATDILRKRIDILKSQKQSKNGKNGIRLEEFKDWMSGVMRRYLFLDDTAHGASGYIDPEDPKWDWKDDKIKYKWVVKDLTSANDEHKYDKHGQWLMDRFSFSNTANERDSCTDLKPLMRALWPEYFDSGTLSLQVLSDTNKSVDKKIKRLQSVYNTPQKHPLPLSRGDRARFVTPTGKINVLLIDDDPEKSPLCDNKYKEIKNTFSVQKFTLKPTDFLGFEWNLKKMLDYRLSYDFALVDLCFGEDPGQDPLGYHVIKKLSKLFPHMPIVVYSRYKDMGHIMRAFQCGAMWFLQKGEEQKLARHLLDVVKKGSWKREWRAMKEFNPVKFVYTGKDPAFDDKFRHTEEWQYLTAKSLEFFPGKFIEVKKMGGGISTASTFSVQKGLKLDGKPLQSPMIIKIDTAANTRMEYERYFRYIRPYIANESGRIEKPCIIIERKCSAIVYTFAGRQDEAHALDSMKNMLKEDIVFKASCDYEKYRKAFDMIFDEILPRIHLVTPNREFGDGEENRHQEVFSRPPALDAGNAKGAAFPNLQFGEVEEEDFYQTYLIRYPHFRKEVLDNDAFKEQPGFDQGKDGKIDFAKLDAEIQKCHPYEFHDVWEQDDGSVDLEVYDYRDDRRPCLLTGSVATHVAKFRQQMHPGMTLWVKNGNNAKPDLMSGKCIDMFEDRVGNETQYNIWIEKVRQYSETILESRAGREYFALVEKVLRFCKALYGTLKDDELNKFLSSDKAGESINEVDELHKGQSNKTKIEHLFNIDEARKFFKHIRGRFKCPIAICHGDLNYGNIMLESRKHPPKDEKPDVSQTITDAWLIDFARTRRDMIAHDVNVMFTDTFALLFDERLFKDAELNYDVRLTEILPRFIRDVMFAKNPNPPDYLNGDARFEFVYKILRRIRKAALDSGISEEMYTLTTVLECLMALKLHLKKGMKNIRASAALFAVAKICFEHLCEDVELDLLSMDKDGKTNKLR